MLELKTMNTQIEPTEEVNILPELVSALALIHRSALSGPSLSL